MNTTETHSTVVRLLYSGRVLHDSMTSSEFALIFDRHHDLAGKMTRIVGGTRIEARGRDRMQTTIYVRDKALIEVVSS